jgi:hypothetical protein
MSHHVASVRHDELDYFSSPCRIEVVAEQPCGPIDVPQRKRW